MRSVTPSMDGPIAPTRTVGGTGGSMGLGDYPNFVGPNERHLYDAPRKERTQMALRTMNADGLLTHHPEAHESMIEDDSERDEPEDDWSLWTFWDGFLAPVRAGTVVGERSSTGPREQTIVWTGERWVCSEDELDDAERSLMDAVDSQCPGGLGGWS